MSICRFLSISFTVIIIHILSEWHAKFRTCVVSFRSFVSCFRDVFQAITRQRWLSHFIWKTLKMSKSFRSLMHISRNLFLCPCLAFIMVIYFISQKRIPCTTPPATKWDKESNEVHACLSNANHLRQFPCIMANNTNCCCHPEWTLYQSASSLHLLMKLLIFPFFAIPIEMK